MFDRKALGPLGLLLAGYALAAFVNPPLQNAADDFWSPTWRLERLAESPDRIEAELRALALAPDANLTVRLPREPADPARLALEVGDDEVSGSCARLTGRSLSLLVDGPNAPKTGCPVSQWLVNQRIRFAVDLDPNSKREESSVSLVSGGAVRPTKISLESGAEENDSSWLHGIVVYGVPVFAFLLIAAGALRLAASGATDRAHVKLLKGFINHNDGSRRFLLYVTELVGKGDDTAVSYFDEVMGRDSVTRAVARALATDANLTTAHGNVNAQQIDDIWDSSFRITIAKSFHEGEATNAMKGAFWSLEDLAGSIKPQFLAFARNALGDNQNEHDNGEPQPDRGPR